MRRYGVGVWVAIAAVAAGADGLCAEQPAYAPALKLEPVGSNPNANKMERKAFDATTDGWRQQFRSYCSNYAPDYADSLWMLGPPREGRLAEPLPLARGGVAMAEIVVDLDPALHTPEATLGRTNYPAEVNPMRHTGPLVVSNAVDELKVWLDTLTGGTFPIRRTPTEAKTHLFVGAHFARPFFPEDLTELGQGDCLDGYSVRARGKDIYIFGATAKGVLNGVYGFRRRVRHSVISSGSIPHA